MKKVQWYHGIRFYIMGVLVALVIIPTLLFWNYTQKLHKENQIRQYADSMNAGLYGVSLMMQNTMETVRNYSLQISTDREFLSMVSRFQEQSGNGNDISKIRGEISLTLGEYVSNLRSLDSIYVYFPDSHHMVTMVPGKKLLPADDSFTQNFYQLYYNKIESPIQWKLLASLDGTDTTLSLIRRIDSADGYGSCVLVCNLNNSVWKDDLIQLTNDGIELLITDFSGRVLLNFDKSNHLSSAMVRDSRFDEALTTTDAQGYYSWNHPDGNSEILYCNAVESGLRYMMSVPEKYILGNGINLNRNFYILLIVCAAISILMGNLLLNQTIIRPIKALIQYMKNGESGSPEEIPEIGSNSNEIRLLFSSYNHMIRRLRQLLDEVNIQQLLRQQTQLSYLQSQMDEHFLFNTLNTVYVESCSENAPATGQMILMLSKYFRLSLSYGKEKLPLNQIAELLSMYLKLQKVRYGHDLRCQIDVFPELDQYKALKYLFQPIVENALVHGFEKNLAGHNIHIVFRKEGDELYFETSDDGNGIPEDKLTHLLEQINGRGVSDTEENFALKNLHEQLCITYGNRDIGIESTYGSGTKVFFTIPLEKI